MIVECEPPSDQLPIAFGDFIEPGHVGFPKVDPTQTIVWNTGIGGINPVVIPADS